MKKIILFSLSLITLNSCDFPDPIPVEGCTNQLALNYNANADTDNNTCDFTADVLFYLNQEAGIFLYNQGVSKITFFIDGNNIGSQYNNNGFFTSPIPPDCFNEIFTTGSVYWSETSYTTINWEAIDENGTIWYESSVTLLANECLKMELSSKKLKNFQINS